MTTAGQAIGQALKLLECPTPENVRHASWLLEECGRMVTPEEAACVRSQLNRIRELLESAWSLRVEYIRKLTVEASGYTASGAAADFIGHGVYEVTA